MRENALEGVKLKRRKEHARRTRNVKVTPVTEATMKYIHE